MLTYYLTVKSCLNYIYQGDLCSESEQRYLLADIKVLGAEADGWWGVNAIKA